MAQDTDDILREVTEKEYAYGFVTDIESEKAAKGLNEDIVRFISAKKNEPEWMLEWRLEAYRHTRSPAVRVVDRRYLISPLGHPLPLFTNLQTEDEITHLADPINVPDPIRRRVMADRLPLYCATRPTSAGAVDNVDPSVALYVNGAEVPREAIVVCNLDDKPGYSGVENTLYQDPKAMLLLGDAKATVAELLKRLA